MTISDEESQTILKRKLTSDTEESAKKVAKLTSDDDKSSTQTLDQEVSDIISSKRKLPQDDSAIPSTSRVKTPIRCSPRKITKRSNSSTDVTKTPKTPKTPKRRGSADTTRKTPRKNNKDIPLNTEFTKEISPQIEKAKCDPIAEERDLNDSQNLCLVLSPSLDDSQEEVTKSIADHSTDPVLVKDRQEVLNPGKINVPRSEGYNYSDQNTNLSQRISKDFKAMTTEQGSANIHSSVLDSPEEMPNLPLTANLSPVSAIKPRKINVSKSEGHNYSDQSTNLSQVSKDFKTITTDQESTDSVSSVLDSPDDIPTITSKLISKLSNGNSSTPTEQDPGSKRGNSNDNESDDTPDMIKLSKQKGRSKNESFRASNSTTPSTISPLPNGHSIPLTTPQTPTFDIHISHNEDGEFLSLYVVRTDLDLGMDIGKEFQRISKRFTVDPYLGDVSSSNSPSSVTSTGMINLPNRTSFASTISSSSTSSNRTSDGNFVVPQPPRKTSSYPGTSTVKGFDSLLKKLRDIFSHLRESSIDDANRSSTDEKVSVGIQASPSSNSAQSNGNASPEEVINYEKATPKSSLKKTRVRGRRPLTGKTKRAILPTQVEEPEYMHGMNSPEMINGDNEKELSVKSPSKDEKSAATPKSVSKLKQKRSRPTSPRSVTPVEKMMKSDHSGIAPDTVVLAKWVDKRYYSGKVVEMIEPNKYLIKFDDGKSKPLLDDFIIFGDLATLPLLGKSVFAMVDKDNNYEPALVLGIDETEGGVFTYRCLTDG